MSKLAEMPVTMSELTPTVAAKIDGHAASLFIDSGAIYSVLKPESAAKFGIRTHPAPAGFFVRGASGGVNASLATAKQFEFAGASYHRVEFLVLPVGHGAVDGLVGQNLLYAVDVEYDLGHGVTRLFQPNGCDDTRLAY